MRALFFPLLAASAAIGLGWNGGFVKDAVASQGQPQGIDAHEDHASASLLGQFRTSFSSWLWLRTDLYLHNGVEMRPLSEIELRAGQKGVGTSDKEMNQLRNEDMIVTIVPPANHDFRGVLGNIERETSPYKEMHGHAHNDPTAALPLFRLMTWVDPSFIAGWTTGAVTIARDHSDAGTSKALAFLEEGLRQNPGSIDLLGQLGYLSITHKHDLKRAATYLEQARDHALSAQDLGEDDKEALRNVYRWLALAYRDLNRKDLERSRLAEACRIFPDDRVLARLLSSAG